MTYRASLFLLFVPFLSTGEYAFVIGRFVIAMIDE
jgi:hypothetical protein